MTKKCTSVVGRFDGHGDAPEGYRRQRSVRHVQGYPGSHWTPQLGNYLLRITPVAARATANKLVTKNTPTLLAILMAAAVRRVKAKPYFIAVQPD
jgi:hypothetical protein